MAHPEAKIDDYEHVIHTDPMLAIRIIRIANSQFFGFHRQTANLYEAISLIGIIQLHDLLLGSLCMRTFSNIPEQILNANDFWRHGVKRGIAALNIARQRGLPATNRYFTLGLLLEIGHALMFIKAPEMTLSALLDSKQQNRAISEVERDYFGFDYAQLGSTLLEHWHLPEVYSQTVEYHLSPEHSAVDFRTAAEIAGLAHRFCETDIINQMDVDQALTSTQPFADFPDPLARHIASEVNRHVEDVFAMLRALPASKTLQ